MTYATRTNHLKAEGAYAVLAKAQALEADGREIIHFEIGQPDFDTFANIGKAGMDAIASGRTRYTPPAGTPSFRRAIAMDASARRGIDISPEQVVVGPGGKPHIFFPTLALVNPGDEVIYPNPGFPTYEAMIGVAGGKAVPVPLVEENNFSFDLDVFDSLINEKTKLIIINSPSNPTGGIIPQADLEHIAAAAKKYDAWVLSDEIYARIVYDGMDDAPSIYALPGMAERTVIMDGFSKTYAMTGWRLGYGIMPEELARRVGLLLTHSVGSTAEFTQFAGIEALNGDQAQVTAVIAEYERRRNVIVDGLNSLPGITCQKPQGAFYVFPNIKATGKTSDEFANWVLEEAGIALLPGTSFGEFGEGYLRLSYANSIENIEKAIEKIARVLK
ncbi:MAG: pyridoxal phosphate-dependent aminotransferase [Anaerolineae bacterium]|jgi:aspartate aminotransferase|nr:pyridoxal phosphate-dependent aminotransferase [Anaerolineae bacterium]MBT7073139.1 pyridoxal phosphate-dependent aminotransferase [Anaerolineae bacterium]MBT7326635.1 pyridoxal phosphate-dependent aminotransferase [Anaerolineae bacterium]